MAYAESNLEVKEPDAKEKAQDDADTRSKVLSNVVGIVDAHSN